MSQNFGSKVKCSRENPTHNTDKTARRQESTSARWGEEGRVPLSTDSCGFLLASPLTSRVCSGRAAVSRQPRRPEEAECRRLPTETSQRVLALPCPLTNSAPSACVRPPCPSTQGSPRKRDLCTWQLARAAATDFKWTGPAIHLAEQK